MHFTYLCSTSTAAALRRAAVPARDITPKYYILCIRFLLFMVMYQPNTTRGRRIIVLRSMIAHANHSFENLSVIRSYLPLFISRIYRFWTRLCGRFSLRGWIFEFLSPCLSLRIQQFIIGSPCFAFHLRLSEPSLSSIVPRYNPASYTSNTLKNFSFRLNHFKQIFR